MLFDVFKGKLGFRLTKRIGMDFDGNMMRRIGRNLAIDMESGELRIVTGWHKNKEDDDDDSFRSSWDDDDW